MLMLIFLLFPFRSAQYGGASEQRQATFRSMSPSQPYMSTNSSAPQTGLGILMNQNNMNSSVNPPATLRPMPNMSAEQRILVQEDLADRERQASSLAAAGMVAESVSYARPQGGNNQQIGLQAPPTLGAAAPPASSEVTEMDGINWNLLDLGNGNLDDLDMDFASLFDPASEAASVSMQNQSGGWTSTPQEQHHAAMGAQSSMQGVSNAAQHSMTEGSS